MYFLDWLRGWAFIQSKCGYKLSVNLLKSVHLNIKVLSSAAYVENTQKSHILTDWNVNNPVSLEKVSNFLDLWAV